MNEVNMLNIGGVDYNIDDQHVRDLIAHSENGLDSQSNLPISSRHYDEGEYLIGQDRYYYEATTDIDPGDVLAEGTNLRKTLLSDEIVALKNQSSIAVIQCIAKRETGALATSSYPLIGSYLYWDYGLTAGLYETIAAITAGDALTIGVNLKAASKIADTMDGLQDAYNITGAKNLCPNDATDTTTTDITWDVLSDGSIQVSGTAAVNRNLKLAESVTLPAGTYKVTTGQADEENALVILHVNRRSDDVVLARSNGASGTPAIFTLQTETTVRFYLTAFKNTTGTAVNVRIFPMCRVASVTDDTYVPFAMTNRLLTSQVIPLLSTVSSLLSTVSDIKRCSINHIGGSTFNGSTISNSIATAYPVSVGTTTFIGTYNWNGQNFIMGYIYWSGNKPYINAIMLGFGRLQYIYCMGETASGVLRNITNTAA